MVWLRIYTFVLHLASWLAFFILVVMIAPRPHVQIFLPHPPFPPFLFLLFPALASFYYLNSLLLIPKVLARQHLGTYLGSLLTSTLLILLIPQLSEQLFPHPDHFRPPHLVSINILISFSLFLIVLIASTGNNIVQNWFSAESQKRAIEFQKTAAELSFLKSQINPHFLFNTLNNIYTLSILKSDKASDSILKLAGMMRYVLSEVGEKSVQLEQEIDYLQQFIDLQKIRLTELVTVDFQVFGSTANKEVAPLLFLPFVENAFKYGVSTHTQSTIKISLTLKPGSIIFQTENQIFEEKLSKELSTGTGLVNARRRLEILYPERHWLRIETIGNTFYMDLTLTEERC